MTRFRSGSSRVLAGAVVLVGSLVGLGGSAAAVAPGCPSDHPTAIGGLIYGYPDNWSLNALVGFDMKDGTRTVDKDGVTLTTFAYGYVDNVNPTLPTTGSSNQGLERHWGRNAGTASLCVSALIDAIYLEIYPEVPPARAAYFRPTSRGTAPPRTTGSPLHRA